MDRNRLSLQPDAQIQFQCDENLILISRREGFTIKEKQPEK